MYENYFGLIERPFSIAPDPQYLYMSRRHKEAMAHLSYGLTQGGCFIVLTGEVGTGKTTLCRNLLSELPDNVDVALILNANINEHELLQSICDELKVAYDQNATQKNLLDAINQHLLATFSDNRHTVLIIDEAQLLSRDVLEQIRLLTNLETTKSKLLQIILIGQPELNDLLTRNDLRQLTQRVTARYHLGPLDKSEIEDYVNFRLSVAGCKRPIFSRQALNKLHTLTEGIPRKINVLADHALLAAYADSARLVDAKTVRTAAGDVFIDKNDSGVTAWWQRNTTKWLVAGLAVLGLNLAIWSLVVGSKPSAQPVPATSQIEEQAEEPVLAPNEVEAAGSVEVAKSETSEIEAGRVIVSEQPLDDSTDIPEQLASEFADALTVAPVPVEAINEPELGASPSTAGFARVEPTAMLAASEFSKLLETTADQTSRISAFRQLARIWDQSLPDTLLQPACQTLASRGLVCLGFSDWQQWLRYNRPAILVVEHQQQLHRVVVTKMLGDSVTLLVGQTELQVPMDELRSKWAGQGVLFWSPGQAGRPFLTMGDSGAQVLAAREQLNLALAASQLPLLGDADSPEFDLDMAQKLFALQTRFGIINDSKIGNETWLLINELTNRQPVPLLRQRG